MGMGLNDISIISGIVILFVFLGVLLPVMEADLNITDSYSTNVDNYTAGLQQQVKSQNSLNIWQVLGSVASMFFWTFGLLPFWLDMIFIILRIVLVVTIARNIWIGGGG
jgi:hypothetical protein